jgi:D-alanyl-D-alanine carboxypeptidase
MGTTRFINANGLPGEGQQSTARDLGLLTEAILRDFPDNAALFAAKMAPVGKRTVSHHNPVLSHVAGGNGMKTGYTCSAGYNIVGSATRDGHRLVAIVLGEKTSARREARIRSLLEYGFERLEWKAFLPPATLDNLAPEPFDAEQVKTENLVKRWKECRDPEPPVDANGNPLCPPVAEGKGGKSAKPVKVAKAAKPAEGEQSAPVACPQQVAAVNKPKTRRNRASR